MYLLYSMHSAVFLHRESSIQDTTNEVIGGKISGMFAATRSKQRIVDINQCITALASKIGHEEE